MADLRGRELIIAHLLCLFGSFCFNCSTQRGKRCSKVPHDTVNRVDSPTIPRQSRCGTAAEGPPPRYSSHSRRRGRQIASSSFREEDSGKVEHSRGCGSISEFLTRWLTSRGQHREAGRRSRPVPCGWPELCNVSRSRSRNMLHHELLLTRASIQPAFKPCSNA
ncbi:hypothetical protein IWZ01DRAFT_295166 [Phyllosticta capitalensis]